MKTKAQIYALAKQWLDSHYPTFGDGAWGIEFISQVFQGEHVGHENRPKVLLALASVE